MVSLRGQDFVGVRHNVEGNKIQDFALIAQKRLTAQGNQTSFTDHAMKIDMRLMHNTPLKC